MLERHCYPCLWRSDSWDNNRKSPKLEFPGIWCWKKRKAEPATAGNCLLKTDLTEPQQAGPITLKERWKLSRQNGSMIGGSHLGRIAKLSLFLALCWNLSLESPKPRRLSGRSLGFFSSSSSHSSWPHWESPHSLLFTTLAKLVYWGQVARA